MDALAAASRPAVSRGRKLLFSAIVAPLVAVALGEIVARLVLPPRATSFGAVAAGDDREQREFERRHPESRTVTHTNNSAVLQVSGSGGMRLRASTSVVIQHHMWSHLDVLVRTNSIGYRNPELGPKTKRRVLFLGDSITLADYLPEEQTFVRLVEMLTSQGPQPLETVNSGVSAIGTENELGILLDTGFGIAPDDVVVDFYLNDVEPSPFIRPVELPAFLRWSRLAAEVAVRLQRARAAWELGHRSGSSGDARAHWLDEIHHDFPPGPGDPRRDPAAFHAQVAGAIDDWGTAWSRSVWTRLDSLLDEMKRETDRRGVALHLVLFPVRPQVEAEFLDDWPQQQARAWASANGVDALDLLPLFRKAEREPHPPFFYDQCHPTAEGHRRIAGWIAAFLTRHEAPPVTPR